MATDVVYDFGQKALRKERHVQVLTSLFVLSGVATWGLAFWALAKLPFWSFTDAAKTDFAYQDPLNVDFTVKIVWFREFRVWG